MIFVLDSIDYPFIYYSNYTGLPFQSTAIDYFFIIDCHQVLTAFISAVCQK